jgi:CHASE3 domain sensor protein/GAF domain-containing protein
MRPNPWTSFKDMRISAKLGLGFGAFVLLALLVAVSSYVGSSAATNKINLTGSVRMPVALTASQAQTDLLRMMSDIRGYLALGDREYWDNYRQSDRAFQADLAALEGLKPDFDALNGARFDQLREAYGEWSALPDRLYRLRNDQLEREPAYRLLATDGVRSAGRVLIGMNSLIDAPREATSQSVAQLQEMAQFEASFAAMLSALRGYTTTRNRIFRQEYEVNLASNEISWGQVWNKRSSLPGDQQVLLDQVRESREAFLGLPEQIFPILEGDRWRMDLYLFRTEALPLTDRMNSLLGEMTSDQQTQLVTDLDDGRQSLAAANRQIIAAGIAAVLIGLVLAFVSRARIAAPIRRLTSVAERIQGGDLAAQARVESRDEIGILARTFNSMTGQLRATLTQVRKEKTRADSLLNVVIPLGVQLSSEKDFNLLLERTVVEARTFCHADGGLLYLRTDEGTLKPVIVRYDPRGVVLGGATGGPVDRAAVPLTAPSGEGQMCPIPVQVTLSGRSVNLDLRDGAQAAGYDLGLETAEIGGAGPASVLAIPLVNNARVVLGVLELLDAKDPEGDRPIPFDANLQQMMESFSSLAVAALEAYIREQSLRQEIRQLRIEIDEVKRQQQVSEIVESDFFQDLQARARAMRGRKSPPLAPE